jgi:hypothetical protein
MKRIWMAVVVVGVAVGAQAQVLDLQTGRGADLTDAANVSIEGGVVLGDADYVGSRVNVRMAERLLLGGNLGLVDDHDDEVAIGAFGIYQLPVNLAVPIALKAGFDTTLDGDVDVRDLSLLVIVSGPINHQIDWYANGGIHIVDVDVDGGPSHPVFGRDHRDDDDVVPTLGGGLVFDFNPQASAFIGLDLLLGDIYDDTVVGGGLRWSFR